MGINATSVFISVSNNYETAAILKKQDTMKKGITIYSAVVFIFVFICDNNVHATSYYVSNSGNDTAEGTSPATAWATTDKINSFTFSAGDSILFKCGDRWNMNNIYLSESGEKNNPIVISGYGTGAKPKLYGSIPVISFSAHPLYSNVYVLDTLIDYDLNYGLPGGSGYGAMMWKVNWTDTLYWSDHYNNAGSLAGLSENYEWYWQNDSMYMYYDGDINDIDTLEVEQYGRGITVAGEYYTVDGIDMKFWGDRCIGMNNWPAVTKHGFELRNCELAYTASREGGVGFGFAVSYCDMIIENNDIHHNGRRNISLNFVSSSSDAVMRDVIIRNNKLHDGHHTTGIDMSMQSQDNYIRNIHIYNNLIYDPYGGNGHQSESIFLQNYEGAADKSHYDSIYIYNNVILNTTLDGVYLEYIGDHVYIVNNTMTGGWIDDVDSWKKTRAFVFYTTSGGHMTVMNNIFCNYTGTSVESFDGASDGGSVLDTFNYNLNYSAQSPNVSYIFTDAPGSGDDWYWSQYSNLADNGYELNSPDPAPPCMLDSTGITAKSASLKISSPAIDAGKSISFVTTDYYGNVRDPLHPTIGAIEYNPDIHTGIKLTKPQNSYTLSLYPNPVSNNLKIELSGGWNSNCSLQLYNMSGIKVLERENINSKKQIINVADFPQGPYFIVISDNSRLKTAKIIIQ